jgi:hypothetical protein
VTVKDAIEFAQNEEIVWYVGAFMFEYHAFPARIVSVEAIFPESEVPCVAVESIGTNQIEKLLIDEIYTDENTALEKAVSMQKKYGHVVIKQEQYDEYMALKNSKN